MKTYNYHELEALKTEILNVMDHFDETSIVSIIHDKINQISDLSTTEKKELYHKLYQSIFKYDIIQPLLDDENISEIMINGVHAIFAENQGLLVKTDLAYSEKQQLLQFIYKIANESGREINLGSPLLDARLKDGSRVNVVLDPVALNGPIVTIRKFKRSFTDPSQLVSAEMITPYISELLGRLIQCKYNLFICGSTGSGKTTLLNCLTAFIDQKERIITIEDAAEIKMDHHENCISLETRKADQATHAIPMAKLIKNALRMRPDRIIVGEVRGEEVIDMLQAMNTGHDGSISTGHSNSPMDMLNRLEVIASSHSDINHTLIRKQIISAIDVLVFVEKLPCGKRKVTQIAELDKSSENYALNVFYNYDVNEEVDLKNVYTHLSKQTKYKRIFKSAL